MRFGFLIIGLIFLFIPVRPFRVCAEKPAEIIVFKVKVAADEYYRAARKDYWRRDLAGLLKKAEREFQGQGEKIKLDIVEISAWRIDDDAETLGQAAHDLANKIPNGNCDLVIGITRKRFPRDPDGLGHYVPPDHIVVKSFSKKIRNGNRFFNEDEVLLAIIMHEIGHFFGLDHSGDPRSLMYKHLLRGDWGETRVKQRKFAKEEIDLMNKNAPEVKKANKALSVK